MPDWVDKLIDIVGANQPGLVSASLLDEIMLTAIGQGASKPRLLEAIGLEDRQLRNHMNRYPGAVLLDLFAALEKIFGDPAAPMVNGASWLPRSFSDVGYATMMLPDLASVVAANAHIQPLRQTMHRLSLEQQGEQFILTWQHPDFTPDLLAAAIEYSVAAHIHFARAVMGPRFRAERIGFAHAARFPLARYVDLLGCPVAFGCDETSLILPAEQLALPLPTCNMDVFQRAGACHQIPVDWLDQGHRFSATTFFYLWTQLDKTALTLGRVARSFGTSERSLRRQLVDEGHPFRELLDSIRQHMCDLYRLDTTQRSLGEVALRLGYSELSAFTRAYRRWYGQPPSQRWRN